MTKKVTGVKHILKERKDELFKLKIRLTVTITPELGFRYLLKLIKLT